MRPKVSVVIPVYGVEKYIARCARSLFEQTLDDMEFIFVDDCTQDASIDVLQKVMLEYPERKRQVSIIHHDKNRGLPQARKSGVLAATGEYVAHCDSDDWVDHHMYKSMYEFAIEDGSDMVVCDYVQSDGEVVQKRFSCCRTTNIAAFTEDMLFQRVSWTLCNKLFKRTAYCRDIVFPNHNMTEDLALSVQLVTKCKRMSYIPEPYYFYYKNPESMTKVLTEGKILRSFQDCKANTDLALNCLVHMPSLDQARLFMQYNVVAHLFPIVHKRRYRQLVLQTYPGLICRILFSAKISFVVKIKLFCALLGFYPNKINY